MITHRLKTCENMLIKKYTTDWVENFEHLKAEIDKGLLGLEYQVEHIGSTSVPGLDSKDVNDIDIISGWVGF